MDSYLRHLQEEIAAATIGLSNVELTRRTDGKWSVAEVLEHLYLTYTGTQKGFERCLKAGKPLTTASTVKQRVSVVLITRLGYFPKGRKSPDRVLPQGMPAEKVVADVGPQIAAMDKLIAQCEERYGPRTKILDHPVLGPLTARQWRKFHLLHGRHHLKQIWQRRQISP